MEDTIISIIIGSIISLIFLFSYLYLNNTLKNLNIFEKINTTFPRIISCFFIVLLIICSTIIASFTLYNLSLFINYNLLNDINIVPISILLILCITYLSCKGINAVIRCSGILIFIWLFLVIISLLTLINYSNPLNLYPFFINKETSIITSSIYYSLYTIMP